MKSLQEYIELRCIVEAIKPPRLNANNKELWRQPTEDDIRKWIEKKCHECGTLLDNWMKNSIKHKNQTKKLYHPSHFGMHNPFPYIMNAYGDENKVQLCSGFLYPIMTHREFYECFIGWLGRMSHQKLVGKCFDYGISVTYSDIKTNHAIKALNERCVEIYKQSLMLYDEKDSTFYLNDGLESHVNIIFDVFQRAFESCAQNNKHYTSISVDWNNNLVYYNDDMTPNQILEFWIDVYDSANLLIDNLFTNVY